MKYRDFGRTGWKVSEISFGAWAIGGSWGAVDDSDSIRALETAIDNGVNLIDTADVYGDGRSERLIAGVLKNNRDKVYVLTKAGRRLSPHLASGYTAQNISQFVDRSLKNLETDCIDLLQLHCPPTQVYYQPEVFYALDQLVQEGKIRHYGVSVEKVEEALKAIEYPNVQSIQIIFNIFRQRPSELLFTETRKRKVAIIARVPLASGLLSGKLSANSEFPQDDHRNFNRYGQAFDQGETFSGVDFESGLAAVDALLPLIPEGCTLAQFALRWILMFNSVTCVIPGAKTPVQSQENAQASLNPPIDPVTMERISAIYDEYIKDDVHHRW